jgi:hypothetical protein
MKKLMPGGGIIGVVAVASISIWILITGGKSLWGTIPLLFGGGEKIANEAIRRVDGILPGVKENIDQVAPGVIDKVGNIIPVVEIPTKDVGGEDIKQIPRHTDLIRKSYAVDNQKRTVVYRGKVEIRVASDFYRKEMVSLGYKEEVVSSSLDQEVYQFKKGMQGLSLTFRRISSIPSQITEVTITEL